MAQKKIILPFLFLLSSFIYCQPPATYFQQEVNYSIDVKLDDVNHYIYASEKIEYVNNSPDTLTFIWFHLWPNAYKNQETALAKQIRENGKLNFHFAEAKDLGWIDSLDFKVEDQKIKTEPDPKHIDIIKLVLNSPLLPGKKIQIATPFRVKLPSATFSRLGHIGQAYAITQWYPKPAVYDVNGWNQMPYLDQGEFYSEWGSFDVRITLPKNYIVGATGDLETEEEISWLDQKVKQTQNKINYRRSLAESGVGYFDSLSFPPSSKEFKTIRYKQKNVHDFAWFADKRFNVLKGQLTLPKSKRKVDCWAMFTDNNFNQWLRAVEYIHDATYYYSLWNGDYQYNQVTAIDGTISAGGGMEYPNITIIGEVSGDFELETVIMHEVGHNWFYGMLGSNERLHAWMDEGINSFNELRYNRTKYPSATVGAILGRDSTNNKFGLNRFSNAYQYYFLYEKAALKNTDQPDELHSAAFTDGNYGAIVYCKTALAFDYLFNYMGEQKFDEAMKFYFEHFHFKHPSPTDLRKTLEYFSGKDLSWFFDDLLGTTKKLDYRVMKYRLEENGSHSVLVKNSGEIKGPVILCGLNNGKLKGLVWYEGFTGEKWLGFPTSEVDELVIDHFMVMPEVNRNNNRIRTSGLFKRIEPIELRFVGMLDDPRRTQLFVTPAAAYNPYNGIMAGLHIHNNLFYEKKFQFDLAPLFGFKNKDLAGLANFQANFHPKNTFQSINVGVNLKRFAFETAPYYMNYNRIEDYVRLELKKKNPRSPMTNSFHIQYISLLVDGFNADTAFTPNILRPVTTNSSIGQIIYLHENERTVNPFSLKVTIEGGQKDGFKFRDDYFSKAWAEFKFHWTMNKKNSGFDFRIFAGTFLANNSTGDYRFRMGGINGYQDYTFSNIYLGRSETTNFAAQQFTEEDGAFKTRMFLGQSSEYLVALNIKTPRLLKVLGFFADVGTCGSDGLFTNGQNVLFDWGINLNILEDRLNFYFPLGYSADIKSGVDANGWNFFQRMKFTFRLEKMNPKKLVDKIIDF
jgi:hypothetical protein